MTRNTLSMVKQQKLLRDGGGPSKVPGVAISITGRSRKCRRHRLSDLKAIKMLSQKRPELDMDGQPGESAIGDVKGGGGVGNNGAVTPGSYANGEGSKEFLSTGRTGRRNAMPDILGHHAETGTADLSTRLEALTTEPGHEQPGTSGIVQGEASTSQQQMG